MHNPKLNDISLAHEWYVPRLLFFFFCFINFFNTLKLGAAAVAELVFLMHDRAAVAGMHIMLFDFISAAAAKVVAAERAVSTIFAINHHFTISAKRRTAY